MSDPYSEVIAHYGRLEFADLLEIGRTNDDYEWIQGRSELGQSFPDGYDSQLINFNLINKTGNVPQVMKWEGEPGIFYWQDPKSGYWGSQRIDWNADTSFNEAYDTPLDRAIQRVEESEVFYDLRQQEHWDREDRVAWEREVSQIVSEEMDNIPGLDRYRSSSFEYNNHIASIRPVFINAVSQDIDNGKLDIEFDCEAMSVFEGSILQKLDEHFLPRRSIEGLESGNYHMRHNYFYAGGQVSFDVSDTKPSGHAFIVSSATGNIIEATTDPSEHWNSPYNESADSDWSFERFARGEVFKAEGQDYAYGGNIASFLTQRAAEKQSTATEQQLSTTINALH